MRIPLALLALLTTVPATAANDGSLLSAHSAARRQAPSSNCRIPQSYRAERTGVESGPLTPRKLTELPPGTTYMAVYRHIGACEAPLTMAQYRGSRRD